MIQSQQEYTAILVGPIPLDVLRAYFKLTQEELAADASLAPNTLRHIEVERIASLKNALKVLHVLNLRRPLHIRELTLKDIAWAVRYKTPLYQLRITDGISAKGIAEQARLSLAVVYKAEEGKPICEMTAEAILTAYNALRRKKRLKAVIMQDLGLTIWHKEPPTPANNVLSLPEWLGDGKAATEQEGHT